MEELSSQVGWLAGAAMEALPGMTSQGKGRPMAQS